MRRTVLAAAIFKPAALLSSGMAAVASAMAPEFAAGWSLQENPPALFIGERLEPPPVKASRLHEPDGVGRHIAA